MNVNLDSKFEKLIKGEAKYTSASLGLNLLISRLQKRYTTKPTAEELKSCVQEINAFFDKYSSIMTKDIDAIKQL